MYLQSIYKLRDEIWTHETGMNLAFDYLFGTSKMYAIIKANMHNKP